MTSQTPRLKRARDTNLGKDYPPVKRRRGEQFVAVKLNCETVIDLDVFDTMEAADAWIKRKGMKHIKKMIREETKDFYDKYKHGAGPGAVLDDVRILEDFDTLLDEAIHSGPMFKEDMYSFHIWAVAK
jgi:hypothetical protein